MTLEQAKEIFSDDRYAIELTGVEIVEVGEHESVCTLAVDSRHRNARGAVMGGALYTLADFAAAVAANSALDTHHPTLDWVSLDATVHYLSPALGDSLEARCTALKHGRSTALYQTVVTCDGRTVAMVETTMMRVG